MARSISEWEYSRMTLNNLITYIKNIAKEDNCFFIEKVYGLDDGGEISRWDLVKFDVDEEAIEAFKLKYESVLNTVYPLSMMKIIDELGEILEENINRTRMNMRILREAEEKAKSRMGQ